MMRLITFNSDYIKRLSLNNAIVTVSIHCLYNDVIRILFRLEHMKMHELHRGHESMHAEMILILFGTLIVSQIGLVKWRQVYPHAYHVSFLVSGLTGF